jgi:hypothetical protein
MEKHKSQSSSLRSLPHRPITLPLWDPNIFLSNLLSNTLSLCSFHNVKYQVSHPYKKWQNYSSVCFDLDILRNQTGTQSILDRMLVGILEVLSTLALLTNATAGSLRTHSESLFVTIRPFNPFGCNNALRHLLSWRSKTHEPPKWRYTSTRLHGVTSS